MRSPSTRPGPIEGKLRGVADEQKVGSVRARLEQGFGEFDVEHRGLVDNDDVLVEWRLGVAGEPAVEFQFAA